MEILDHFSGIIANVAMPIVIELGMCDGYHSDLMIKEIKSTDRPFVYHGFEPNSPLHSQILNKLKGHLMFNNGLISVFPHAIGDTIGEVDFYVSSGSKIVKNTIVTNYYGSSSILTPTDAIKKDFNGISFKKTRVFSTTLDHHLVTHGLLNKKIDFIWSDIQGAEIKMLKGAENTMRNVRYLYTEYSDAKHYERQSTKNGILEMLPDFEVIEDYGGDFLLKNKSL